MAVAAAEVERYAALAEQARVQAERTQRLADEGIATAQELDRARAEQQSTIANLKLGRAGLRSAGLNVQFTRITSPLNGRTGSLLIHAGNVVRAGEQAPLVVIRQLSPVQVKFAVPEEYVAKIRELSKQGALTVRVTPKGHSGAALAAPLTFLENSVDVATGTLTLKATYQNSGLELWPGVAVDVVLVLDTEKQAIVAPGAAVQRAQEGAFAFVVEQGRAKLRRIEVARTTPSFSVIRSGLTGGEQVVVEGLVRLRDGSKVTLKPPTSEQPEKSGRRPEAVSR
jgi:multidrug efflux system membrane fusion protein